MGVDLVTWRHYWHGPGCVPKSPIHYLFDFNINVTIDILFSRSVDNGRSWSTPKYVNAWAPSDGTATDTAPTVARISPSGGNDVIYNL